MAASNLDLRIKSEYSLIAHSANIVELRAGVWNTRSMTLTDSSEAGTLLPMLRGLQDGQPHAEIARTCGVARSELEALVDSLAETGVLQSGQTGSLNALLEKMASLPMIEKPSNARVLLLGSEELTAAVARHLGSDLPGQVEIVERTHPLARRLYEFNEMSFTDGLVNEGIFDEFADWRDSVVVFLSTVINPLAFRAMDELAQGVGFVWIHGAVDGPFVFIGPTIIPGRTATYADFEQRLMMNMRELASYQKYKAALAEGLVRGVANNLAAPLVDLLSAHATMEVVNWIESGSNFTLNRVLGIYLPTMEMAFHEILPTPYGSAASSLQTRDSTDLYFNARDWLNV